MAYAAGSLVGLCHTADCNCLEAFLHRSVNFGSSSPTLAAISSEADRKLFAQIISNAYYLLLRHLPPLRDTYYNLRDRAHNYQLPSHTSALLDCNFLIQMLYNY
jgi:hypothetical protein